jgi:hypothetical protein
MKNEGLKLKKQIITAIIFLFFSSWCYAADSTPLVSGETWGVTRGKINANDAEHDTRLDALESGKQDAATAATDSELSAGLATKLDEPTGTPDGTKFAADDGTWKTPSGSTITADGTDPTKAAVAVLADTATHATSADSATTATNATYATSADSATTADTATSATSATSSASSDYATEAGSLAPTKTSGVPGMDKLFEASGTSTNGVYLLGPDALSSGQIAIKLPSGAPGASGDMMILTGPTTETMPDGTESVPTYTIETATPSSGGVAIDDETPSLTTAYSGTKIETLISGIMAALESYGLNVFTWNFTVPSSAPYYVASTSAVFAFTITDTSSTNDPDSVLFQVNSGGYGTDCGSLTGCTVTGLTENDSNTVQFQVSDDHSPVNTGESQEFAVISDTTAPVGVADADGTHTGTGDSITSGIDWTETYLDTSTVSCSVVNATPPAPEIICVGNACDTELLTPDDNSSTVTCTWAADDRAGNPATGTRLVQNFTYDSGLAYTFSWDCETTTAKLAEGTETATENNSPELSTDHPYTGTYSGKFSTGNSRYTFDDSTIFDPLKSYRITLYFFGNYTDGKDMVSFGIFGDTSSNFLQLQSISGDYLQLYARGGGTSTYLASTTALTSSMYNKVVITFDGSSGTQIDYSISINDGTADTASGGTIWEVSFAYMHIGIFGSSAPTSAMYLDDILIEEL